ncbi:ABC transporter substrate-binding protein [Carpediemonas membranifera]|uniref:ABC transporter substrate-binding protein n=1 Tax=Carpediemonas membranifera TaxID=201153 RepID=A0A8J6B575_9EUKA|nr:ABC transporter substrate-binding protein [Carpediemonas membranifera]|eukprot:KAG9393122.1 ABC transporter substrate-binding protein [Carpediemonas membranifera]
MNPGVTKRIHRVHDRSFEAPTLSSRCSSFCLAYCLIAIVALSHGANAATQVSLVAPGDTITSYTLQSLADDFNAAQSDVAVSVTILPSNADYYSIIKGSLALGDLTYDAIALAQVYLLDILLSGVSSASDTDQWKLEPLTDRVAQSELIDWNDVSLFSRTVGSSFNKDVYAVPFDGDFHYLFYRADVLQAYGQEVPDTVEELVALGEHLMTSTGMTADPGMPDVAFCVTNMDASRLYRFVADFAMPYLQYSGTDQGGFFSTDDMRNFFDTDAFKKGIELFKKTLEFGFGPNVAVTLDESRAAFLNGTCAMTVDWGDIFFLAPQSTVPAVTTSTGSAVFPGATSVYDRSAGSMKECTAALCPFATEETAVGKLVNRAPLAASGGQSIAIPATSSNKDAVFRLLEWAASPRVINPVTLAGSGLEPFRASIGDDDAIWADKGLTAAKAWILPAIDAMMSHGNVVLDMRLPGLTEYVDAMNAHFTAYLYDGADLDGTMSDLSAAVEAITDDHDRDMQLLYYRMNLGVDPLTQLTLDDIFLAVGIGACVAAFISIVLTTALTVLLGYIIRDSNFKFATPSFLIAGNVGWMLATLGVAMFVVSFAWSTTGLCIGMLLCIGLGVTIALGSLFAKQARIYWILRATRSHKKRFTVPSDLHLLPLVVVGIPLPVTLIVVWTIVDTFKMTDHPLDDYTQCTVCRSAHAALWAISCLALAILFLAPNGVLVFKTRKLPVSETRALSLTVQISAVLGGVIALVYAIASDPLVHPKVVPPIFAAGVILIQAVTFAPKVWKAARRQPLSKRDYHLLTGKGDATIDGFLRCPHCLACHAAFGNQISKTEAINGGYNPSSGSPDGSHRAHSIVSAFSSKSNHRDAKLPEPNSAMNNAFALGGVQGHMLMATFSDTLSMPASRVAAAGISWMNGAPVDILDAPSVSSSGRGRCSHDEGEPGVEVESETPYSYYSYNSGSSRENI